MCKIGILRFETISEAHEFLRDGGTSDNLPENWTINEKGFYKPTKNKKD